MTAYYFIEYIQHVGAESMAYERNCIRKCDTIDQVKRFINPKKMQEHSQDLKGVYIAERLAVHPIFEDIRIHAENEVVLPDDR